MHILRFLLFYITHSPTCVEQVRLGLTLMIGSLLLASQTNNPAVFRAAVCGCSLATVCINWFVEQIACFFECVLTAAFLNIRSLCLTTATLKYPIILSYFASSFSFGVPNFPSRCYLSPPK